VAGTDVVMPSIAHWRPRSRRLPSAKRPRLGVRGLHVPPAPPHGGVADGACRDGPAAAAERLEHSDGGALFHKTYRHLYEGEKRTQAKRQEALVLGRVGRGRDSRWRGWPGAGSTKPIVTMGGTGLEPVTPSLSSVLGPGSYNRYARARRMD